VELLAPLAEDTPVGRFLTRRGEGMHHLAFGVADVAGELARLRAAGATLIDEQPRTGVYGAMAFVHHESLGGVLSELIQSNEVTEA
jgi:methylmalonyl-CoA epimerase